MAVDIRLTYEDYCLLSTGGKRHEIIDGEHFVTPSPFTLHQRVVMRLGYHLMTYLLAYPLGEVFVAPFDVVFSRFDVVEPDLLYVSKDRSSIVTRKNIQGAPDLVVEMLWEGTAHIDRNTKQKLYSRFGVREYWVIDPAAPSAEIHRAGKEGFQLAINLSADGSLTSPLLSSFNVPLSKLVE